MFDGAGVGRKRFEQERASEPSPVLNLIHPKVLERAALLHDEFQSNTPFRHVVIDELLVPEFYERLASEFPAFDPKRALNEFGEVGLKAVVQHIRHIGPAYQELDRMLQSKRFLLFVSRLTGIPDLRYDPEYIGGGTHENLSGQDLDPHVDFNYHPRTNLHRRLNLILFLNPRWEAEWGGSLELHLNPWLPPAENQIKTILPMRNRCVLFETSEHSWHGFKRIEHPSDQGKLSRRSIAVYFYTQRRPRDETAPQHSTVYVQRPLPDHITAGYTLEEEDALLIRTLISRRDKQIQYLYERELDFSSVLSNILESPVYRLAQLLVGPLRKLWRLVRFQKAPRVSLKPTRQTVVEDQGNRAAK